MVSPEQRRQIIAEPSSMPLQQIAYKHGVSWYLAKKIREDANSTALALPEPAPVILDGGTIYDSAITAVEEQLDMFQSALSVLQGLRDLALQEKAVLSEA
jgi:hypothetical protein